jgi:hypothetical protein
VAISRKLACFREDSTDFVLSVRGHFTDSFETMLHTPLMGGVRDRRGRPTYLGYGQLEIASVGKNEGNGLRTKNSEV